MKRILLLVLLLLPSASSPLFCQIYRTGDAYLPASSSSSVPFRWELSAGAVLSSSSIESAQGKTLVGGQYGGNARLVYFLTSWLSLGVEGTVFSSREGGDSVKKYSMRRMGLVSKILFAEGTTPRSYFLVGYGVTQREFDHVFLPSDSDSSTYIVLGLGLELDVTDSLFLGLEMSALRNSKDKLPSNLALDNRWEADAGIRLGLRF